jgi:hypothetical protein
MNERNLYTTLIHVQTEALTARILLDELRAGRLPNAIELLERSLDTGVLAIGTLMQKTGSFEQGQATGVLQILRDYRQRHPRKPEASIEGDEESELRKTQQKVQKILFGR